MDCVFFFVFIYIIYMYHDFLADDDDWVLISLDLLPQKKTHANANGKDLLMMDYHRGLRLMMMVSEGN